ncbi:MAG: histidine ammonia-lyase [Calditrichaeota bacterium]|nr:MAG: histidine ammonia-lyase [Calditrichota bacterium]MBL1204071.1 histidine ammonia-lyase [Calditrichota bacterium]NOG43902.1 histidine ammonia-lyase [Calditrichota bacterium]
MKTFIIDEQDLSLEQLADFLKDKPKVAISESVKGKIRKGHSVIQNIVKSGEVVYGVNTGFGKFADVRIEPDKTKELQRKLVLSHAAGIGDPFEEDIVRLMMVLKIKNLSQGYSGVRIEVVEQLVNMLNNDIIPIIPAKGSVGASGDLAPLAHMALTMIGEGHSFVKEKDVLVKMTSKEALKMAGLKPLHLMEKEGLAILNGTQAIQANGVLALISMKNLVKSADIIGAISLECLHGTLTAFDERIHKIRRHPGQVQVAENFRNILQGSPIVASHKHSDHRVQDAYCLRCIPQVHGSVRDGLKHVQSVFEREINGVTDNPLVFPDNGDVLSGGNFHGEPVALAADYLAIIAAELANISERRIEHMMDSSLSELAGFLTTEGGLNSGFMIAHVTAAALVSENKVLAHPASVDSIPTSANKEDHVSMGTHAARKALEVIKNAVYVLAVELICGCQALDLRKPVSPSKVTKAVLDKVRSKIDYWEEDRLMNTDIEEAYTLINNKSIVEVVEKKTDNLH